MLIRKQSTVDDFYKHQRRLAVEPSKIFVLQNIRVDLLEMQYNVLCLGFVHSPPFIETPLIEVALYSRE